MGIENKDQNITKTFLYRGFSHQFALFLLTGRGAN